MAISFLCWKKKNNHISLSPYCSKTHRAGRGTAQSRRALYSPVRKYRNRFIFCFFFIKGIGNLAQGKLHILSKETSGRFSVCRRISMWLPLSLLAMQTKNHTPDHVDLSKRSFTSRPGAGREYLKNRHFFHDAGNGIFAHRR